MKNGSRFSAAAREELARRLARSNLEAFTTYTMPSYQVCWFHEVMCRYLDRFVAGEIKRLMVFMPPRHGKSELVSRRLPAYILGRDPDATIIAASHTAGLAADMNRDVQRIIDSDEYRRLFPGTRLWGANVRTIATGTWLRNSDLFEIVDRKGAYFGSGVGGSLAGRGGTFLVIDDIFGKREDAESDAMRRKLIDWFGSDMYTRRASDESGVLLTMTRWHMDDLAGHLLKQARENPSLPQWTVLRFPALAEEIDRDPEEIRQPGEALWPEKFSAKSLLETRDACGSRDWASLYQQRPVPSGGVVFKKDLFKYFSADVDADGTVLITLPDPSSDQVRYFSAQDCMFFQCVDTAMTVSKHSAFTAVLTFCLTPRCDLLVWHVWRKKLEVPDQLAALFDLRERSEISVNGVEMGEPWPKPLAFQAVEERASGHGLIQAAAARGRPFRRLKADTDKVSRAAVAATWYQNGKIYHRKAGPWLTLFEDEILCFPSSANKDMADCLSHGAIVANADEFLRLRDDRPLFVWPALPGSEDERLMREMDNDIVPMPRFLPPPEPESIEQMTARIVREMDADDR